MRTRVAAALLTLGCAAALLTATTGPGAAAVARCDGRVPTVVGSGRVVTGTQGDDVIVLLGRSSRVDAGAGDDRVCVRGRGGWKSVIGGPGDDRVRVEVRARVLADLRAGTDSFRGGPGPDLVISGSPGARSRDRVRLGGGSDTLVLDGRDHRRAVLRGGRGDDLLRVQRRGGALEVDAGASVAVVDGRTHARWTSFESYALNSGGRQSFVGSDRDDDVSFGGRGAVEAVTGDGDDVVGLRFDPGPSVLLPGAASEGPRVLLDTGDGSDELAVGTSASVVVGDLTTDLIAFSEEDGPVGSFGAVGVEHLSVSAPVDAARDPRSRVELVGDDLDNTLSASACHVVLRGAGGDDELAVGLDPPDGFFMTAGGIDRGCRRTSEVYGGLGDDSLSSRVTTYDFRDLDVGDTAEEVELPVTDLLDGGEGVDTADAGAGRDTCLAETRISCEA